MEEEVLLDDYLYSDMKKYLKAMSDIINVTDMLNVEYPEEKKLVTYHKTLGCTQLRVEGKTVVPVILFNKRAERYSRRGLEFEVGLSGRGEFFLKEAKIDLMKTFDEDEDDETFQKALQEEAARLKEETQEVVSDEEKDLTP